MTASLRADELVLYARVGEMHIGSFALGPGGLALIVGGVGTGKSDLLLCLATGAGIAAGRVQVSTRTFDGRPTPLAWRHGIALVHQHRLIFADLSASDNLRMGWSLGPATLTWKECLRRCCDSTDTLKPLLSRRSDTLSGGERRMLAVLRAHASEPSVVLLDEPMSGMDWHRRQWLFAMIDRWRSDGHIVLMSAQDGDGELPPRPDIIISLSQGGAVASITSHARVRSG